MGFLPNRQTHEVEILQFVIICPYHCWPKMIQLSNIYMSDYLVYNLFFEITNRGPKEMVLLHINLFQLMVICGSTLPEQLGTHIQPLKDWVQRFVST